MRAICLFAMKMFEEACVDFSALINGGNGTIEDYEYRAYCELCLGMIDEFIVDILHDRDASGIVDLDAGFLMREVEDYKEVIIKLSRVIEADPDYIKAILLRARCYEGVDDWGKAIDDYTRLIKLTGEEYYYYALRGYSYVKAKSYDKAIDDFTHALKLNPTNLFCLRNRGETFCRIKKDYKKAIEDCTKLIELSGGDEWFARRGKMYYKLGRIHEAIKDFDEAISLNEEKDYFIARGYYLAENGSSEKAIDDFKYALKMAKEEKEPD
jgi:tetratricopeptide (TPR) repeat protein